MFEFRGRRPRVDQEPQDRRLLALRSNAELSFCSDSQLRTLLPNADEVDLPAHLRVAAEGRPCDQFLVVIDGRLRESSGSLGSRVLETGQGFGWKPMWWRGDNEASLVAESDAHVLVMSHAQFRAVKALAPRPAARHDDGPDPAA